MNTDDPSNTSAFDKVKALLPKLTYREVQVLRLVLVQVLNAMERRNAVPAEAAKGVRLSAIKAS